MHVVPKGQKSLLELLSKEGVNIAKAMIMAIVCIPHTNELNKETG